MILAISYPLSRRSEDSRMESISHSRYVRDSHDPFGPYKQAAEQNIQSGYKLIRQHGIVGDHAQADAVIGLAGDLVHAPRQLELCRRQGHRFRVVGEIA